MRVAIVTDTYTPQVNGVTTVLRRIVDALRVAKHDALITAPRYPVQANTGHAQELRVPSIPFPPYPAIRLSLPQFQKVSNLVAEFDPDVVHVATEGPLGVVGRNVAVRHGLPLVTSFHTNFPTYCRDYGVSALKPLVWRWLTWFHGPAVITHTPGNAVQRELIERGITHATVGGRGVDTQRFRPTLRDTAWRSDHGFPDDAIVVLHVGRLAVEKNLDVLMEAWPIARHALGERARFLIAGDGPVARRIDKTMPWVTRMGFLDPMSLARVYANSDICVLPSSTETCGLVALEAMASGVAVLAADAGGFRESIRHGVNGLLVPADDPHAFAARIAQLAMETGVRRELATEARQSVLSRDIRIEDAQLLEHYQTAADTHELEAAWSAAQSFCSSMGSGLTPLHPAGCHRCIASAAITSARSMLKPFGQARPSPHSRRWPPA